MSDANRVQLSYRKEVTYGTIDPGAFKTVRFTGESLQQAIDTTVSQEIRADRQTADFIRTGLRSNGDTNWEYSYKTYQDLFEYGLFSAPGTTAVVVTLGATTVAVGGSAGTFTLTRSAGDWIADGITTAKIGQWVRTTGFVNAANNDTAKVLTVTAAVLTVTHCSFVTESAVASTTVTLLSELTAGTTLSSVSIEKAYTDNATAFAEYTGQLINQMSMTGTANGIITGSFGWLGKSEVSRSATIGTSYTPSHSTVTPVMNGIDNLVACFEGGASNPLFSFNFTINNNLRERLQMGTLGPISIATGQIAISGQIVLYFVDATLPNKFLNFTASNLVLKFRDASGNRQIWDFPRVKYSTGPRTAGGINQDVFITLGFQGFLHSTQLQSLRVALSDGP